MWAALLMNGLVAAVVTLLLFTSGFFLLFTPLPIAYLFVRKGRWVAAVAGMTAFLLLALLYQLPIKLPLVETMLPMLPMMAFEPTLGHQQVMSLGLVYLFYFLWIGFNLGVVSRKRWSVEKSFGYLIFSSIIVPGAVLLLAFQGFSFLSDIRMSFYEAIDRMIAMQKEAGANGEELLFLQKYKEDIVRDALSLIPSLWICFLTMALALNASFLKRLCLQERLMGILFPAWVEFPVWRLMEGLIWAPIAAAAVYLGNTYSLNNEWVEVVALNVLIVFALVYFIQGLAIVSFLLRTRLGSNGMLRLTAYLLIFLFLQFFGILILALGIFDFWFDFRKLKKQK